MFLNAFLLCINVISRVVVKMPTKNKKRYKNKFQEGTRKKEYMVSKNTTRDCKNLVMPLQTQITLSQL